MSAPSPTPASQGLARSGVRATAMLALLAALAGCGTPPKPEPPKLRVVLLPQTDEAGQPRATAVNVSVGSTAAVLDVPYALAERNAQGELKQRVATAEEVEALYGDLLKIQPPAPQTFVLRFQTGTSQLTPESAAELPRLIALARSRAGGDIVVVGHTDRQGKAEANDALSLRRAQAVAQLLAAQGFPPDLISAVGRGEREPVVPTADEVAEPRNRRAEITVR